LNFQSTSRATEIHKHVVSVEDDREDLRRRKVVIAFSTCMGLTERVLLRRRNTESFIR
jgi:hypothetical protein